jgi:hypothetical protein
MLASTNTVHESVNIMHASAEMAAAGESAACRFLAVAPGSTIDRDSSDRDSSGNDGGCALWETARDVLIICRKLGCRRCVLTFLTCVRAVFILGWSMRAIEMCTSLALILALPPQPPTSSPMTFSMLLNPHAHACHDELQSTAQYYFVLLAVQRHARGVHVLSVSGNA